MSKANNRFTKEYFNLAEQAHELHINSLRKVNKYQLLN